MLRRVLSSLLLCSMAFAGGFDKPVSKRSIDLGPSSTDPKTHVKINCYYFSTFMVKEVDLGEKGASRLAIVPASKRNTPACTRLRDQGERVVNPDDWSGYFKGVKGHLVFFDADDGWNGGVGFAVYDAKTGKKIFDDLAVGDLEFSEAKDAENTIRYTRLVDGGCVVPKEADACWEKIQQRFALIGSAPDCKAGYESSAQALAKGRCQSQNADNPQCLAREIALARQQTGGANSVIAYRVETVLSANPTTRPVAGDLRCWPSD